MAVVLGFLLPETGAWALWSMSVLEVQTAKQRHAPAARAFRFFALQAAAGARLALDLLLPAVQAGQSQSLPRLVGLGQAPGRVDDLSVHLSGNAESAFVHVELTFACHILDT